ncbi:hypothetical protein PSCICM_07980 [Pseudomonas cichorii]|nr:hypothetical protein PSCICM_07980 [Pseudomonas cichorii]
MFHTPDSATTVPGLQHFATFAQQRNPPTGIDAFADQHLSTEGMNIDEIGWRAFFPKPGVVAANRPASRIKERAIDTQGRRIIGLLAVPGHGAHRQTPRINDRERRCVSM